MLVRGTHDPSLNANAYPMTDETTFTSAVRISIAGQTISSFDLPDDPADHPGILSWFSQNRDRRLHEAGSYGYLVHALISSALLRQAAANNEIIVRLEVDPTLPGGLAIYDERFGRYPIDPTLTSTLNTMTIHPN